MSTPECTLDTLLQVANELRQRSEEFLASQLPDHQAELHAAAGRIPASVISSFHKSSEGMQVDSPAIPGGGGAADWHLLELFSCPAVQCPPCVLAPQSVSRSIAHCHTDSLALHQKAAGKRLSKFVACFLVITFVCTLKASQTRYICTHPHRSTLWQGEGSPAANLGGHL